MRLGRIELPEWELYQPGRDELRLGGLISEPGELTADGLLARAEALVAMERDVDETVIPAVIDGEGGFFRVESVSVDPGPVGLAVGWLAYEARPTPMRVREPVVESVVIGALRATSNAVPGTLPWQAVPVGVSSWRYSGSQTVGVRDCEGGQVHYADQNGSASGSARWSCPAEPWYVGACGAEVAADGTWFPHVGRGSLPADPALWRAGNGLVRWQVAASGELLVSWWRPAGWSTPVGFRVGAAGAGYVWRSATVVRAAPEELRVRLDGSRVDRLIPARCWVTVRRGGRQLDCRVEVDFSSAPFAPGFALGWLSGVGSNSGYYVARTTAAEGVKWVVAADHYTFGSGQIVPDDANALGWSFGVTAEVAGGGVHSTVVEVAQAWYATQSERVTVGVVPS